MANFIHKLKMTTDASGDATLTSDVLDGYWIDYLHVDSSSNVATGDVTITEATSGMEILKLTNVAANETKTYRPRGMLQVPAGTDISGTEGAFHVGGDIKIVIDEGGNAQEWEFVFGVMTERP